VYYSPLKTTLPPSSTSGTQDTNSSPTLSGFEAIETARGIKNSLENKYQTLPE
jgi:hypothetical protein